MKTKLKLAAAATALTITATIAPTPTDAASWGQASNVWFNSSTNRWHGTVDDTKRDRRCVELWTITSNGSKVDRIARSCGAPTTGTSSGQWNSESTLGVRMYRTDGRYQTIVHPG